MDTASGHIAGTRFFNTKCDENARSNNSWSETAVKALQPLNDSASRNEIFRNNRIKDTKAIVNATNGGVSDGFVAVAASHITGGHELEFREWSLYPCRWYVGLHAG